MQYVPINLQIKENLIKKAEEVVAYKNYQNKIYHNLDADYTVEHLIVGALANEIERINKFNDLISHTGLSDLGKPYKLKNTFKNLLKQRDIKQIDLATDTGIDKGNLSLILNNKTQPSLDYFLRIWITLGCPPMEDILYREKL